MAFQSIIYPQQGFGVPGDLYNDSPKRSRSYILNSGSPNIIGTTCYTQTSGSNDQVATAGNTGNVFVGILVNSKVYASFGPPGGNPLAPTLTLANQTQAELLTMGTIITFLPNTANPGDLVIFDDVTGAISTISPVASLPSGKTFAQAQVDFYIVSTGMAVITFTPSILGVAAPAPFIPSPVTNDVNVKKVKGLN
jgi:hypothetical protein